MPAHAIDNELLEETIKRTAEEVSKKSTEEFKKVLEESSGSGGSRISQILKRAKGTSIDEIEKIRAEKEKIEREKSKLEESITECPNCVTKGHSHALRYIGNEKVKCTGGDCGAEYALISTNADYKCKTCGSPKKKPEKSGDDDICLFCNGDEFIKYDWNKMKKNNKMK
jgi:hypothetical protein